MPSGVYEHKRPSEVTRLRISLANRGRVTWNKGKHWDRSKYPVTEKTRLATSLAHKGKHPSQETRRKVSLTKISQALYGEKSASWKGGYSSIDRPCRQMPEYRQWRSDVFSRDNWTCQTCHQRAIYVTAHHIKGFSKMIRENNIRSIGDARTCMELWDVSNGVTLCEPCHSLTDNYKGRAQSRV